MSKPNVKDVIRDVIKDVIKGGSRNSSRGEGSGPEFFKGGGGGVRVQVRRNFHILTSKKEHLGGGGVTPLTPPPPGPATGHMLQDRGTHVAYAIIPVTYGSVCSNDNMFYLGKTPNPHQSKQIK